MNDKMQAMSAQCDWKVTFCTSQIFFWEANVNILIFFTFSLNQRMWLMFFHCSQQISCAQHIFHFLVLSLDVSVLSLKHLFYMRAKSWLKEKSQSVFHFRVPLGKGDIVVRYIFPEICLPHLTMYWAQNWGRTEKYFFFRIQTQLDCV